MPNPRESGHCYRFPLALIALALTLPGGANAAHGEKGFWSFQLENDLLGKNDDHFYTSGWQFNYLSPHKPPPSLENLTDNVPFYRKDDIGFYGYNVGQQIFTPDNITATTLQVGDRPYAGWLFGELYVGHRYIDHGDFERINGLILTVGVVGPAAMAEETQKLIHSITGSDNPRGWDNQLENELGVNASYLRKRRFIFNLEGKRQWEFGTHAGMTLGNVYSYAALGVMLRWGTQLKDDIGPPSMRPGFPGLAAFNPYRQANWYVFTGLETRVVARNIFLDGNTNVDSHSVEKKDLVGDLQLGFALRVDNARISFSQLFRSKEFENQPKSTQYGAINFTLFVD